MGKRWRHETPEIQMARDTASTETASKKGKDAAVLAITLPATLAGVTALFNHQSGTGLSAQELAGSLALLYPVFLPIVLSIAWRRAVIACTGMLLLWICALAFFALQPPGPAPGGGASLAPLAFVALGTLASAIGVLAGWAIARSGRSRGAR